MNRIQFFDRSSQIAIPLFTLSGILAISLKHPALGLVLNLTAQPFWIYSTWKSYKKAGQIGMFINTIVMTLITVFGVLNYWVFS
ncbi:hypothetical protein C0584_04715 [Candidatus Parcubacteria bacterium]|nr:MAG: hypothetical protein C0584_04715 [Candidatus Parcubacteria bacterium]